MMGFMKKHICFIALFLIITVPAFASKQDREISLCGHPVELNNQDIEKAIEEKVIILSEFWFDIDFRHKVKETRDLIISEYPDQDIDTVDQYLVYQSCALLMGSQDIDLEEKVTKLFFIRKIFQSVFDEQILYEKCRKREFGVEKWGKEEIFSQSSGWMGGGSNQSAWCNRVTQMFVQGKNLKEGDYSSAIIDSREQGKWTWVRERLYMYTCTIKVQWNPTYIERADPSCSSNMK